MNKITAINNLQDNIWVFNKENDFAYSYDLYIGFTDGNNTVKFNNLIFTIDIFENNELKNSYTFPKGLTQYIETDQPFIESVRIRTKPETNYTIKINSTNNNISSLGEYNFYIDKPPQPYPSWIWENDNWHAPVPYPEDGDYDWDEENGNWVIADINY